MDDLDAEIAKLEEQLARLRAERRRLLGDSKPWELPDCFSVNTPDEIALTGLPELARLILDALPVSVFVKHADIVDGRGRLFTYINLKARKILGWNEDKVASKYDSEAFLGGYESDLYQVMLNQETDTLQGLKSRVTQLEWKPGEEFWRRARTWEIPIITHGDEKKSIGFCAIAEEEEFQLFPFIHSWLREVFQHEYKNMSVKILNCIGKVEDLLNDVKSLCINTPEVQQQLSLSINERLYDLKQAQRWLKTYGRTAEGIYQAFIPTDYSEVVSVKDLASEIEQVYEDAPFDVMIEVNSEIDQSGLRKANAIKGVIIALIGNGVKHSKDKIKARLQIKISVLSQDDQVVFVISNRGETHGHNLTLRTFANRAEADTSMTGLSGVIIGEILSRAFPIDVALTKMIEGPENIVGGWVEVKLLCEKANF